MTKTFWLSYDLGLNGDYNGLYTWLDSNQAKECGDSLAVFKFEYEDDYVNEIKVDLKENVNFKSSDRVYLIFRDREDDNIVKGRFLIGRRKPAPWEGYSIGDEELHEDF